MYEQGVIRPPSEARSLLVRVTRNCPWNRYLFCPAYKGVKFSKRSVEEAGLTRIPAGLESGSEKVLKMIKKGITPEDILEAGKKVMEAGISLSEYIMPGVGGRTLSEEHARETAGLLNQIRPDFIRVRTFALPPQSPMKKMVDAGFFEPMTDEEMVAEIRLLVSCLDEIHSFFSCERD